MRLCGYKNGEIENGHKKECQNGIPKLTLEEIAKQLGTSKSNLQRALSIERNLTDSMKELHKDYDHIWYCSTVTAFNENIWRVFLND